VIEEISGSGEVLATGKGNDILLRELTTEDTKEIYTEDTEENAKNFSSLHDIDCISILYWGFAILRMSGGNTRRGRLPIAPTIHFIFMNA